VADLTPEEIEILPIPGLRALHRSRSAVGTLYLRCVLAGAVVHVVGQLLFRGVDPDSAVLALVPGGLSDLVILSLFMGAGTGFFVANTVYAARLVTSRLDPQFRSLDPSIGKLLEAARPTWWRTLTSCVILVAVLAVLIDEMVSSVTGLSLQDPAGVFAAGSAVAFQLYLVLPLNHLVGGVMLSAALNVRHYLMAVARGIRIDMLDAEAYSVITVAPLLVVGVGSVILSIAGVLAILAPPAANVLTIAVAVGLGTGVLMVAMAWPLFVLRDRFVAAISGEKQALKEALRGQEGAVDRSLLAEEGMSRSELMTCLVVAETLSEWPVGVETRRFVLFGVIPPSAWVLAAIVENLLY
jgi:hypothetical protein